MVNYIHHMIPIGQCTNKKRGPTNHSIQGWIKQHGYNAKETCSETPAKTHGGKKLSVMQYHDN